MRYYSKLYVLRTLKLTISNQFRFKSTIREERIDNRRKLSQYRNYATTRVDVSNVGKRETFLPISSPSKMTRKVVLVTGGSSHFGLLCVKELLSGGAKAIMIADMNEKAGKDAICELSKEFGENRAAFIKTDVADIKLLRNAFNWTKKHFEHIDIVVNIAKQVRTESWVEQIEKNVKGVVRCTLLGFEYMGTQNGGQGGTVLNMITSPTLNDAQECPMFVGARHYLIGFGRAMSNQYFKETSVKVVSLCTDEEKLESSDESGVGSIGCDLSSIALSAKEGSVWTNF
ncbi:hypothetical protein JTB14_004798 [Gonioctena quinquepunctata]|nr:hypothetical protein JTB14_004798 [Gonioctena quinquepunctata]